MIARLTARYVLVFLVVLTAINAVAYVFMSRSYAAELGPALETPEGAAAYAAAMRHVLVSILLFDVPLVMLVSGASYVLARTHLEPLLAARERERRFAADAAHELRSPLATIATVAQAARVGAQPEIQASLDTIIRAALDASAIVGDLLTLAREPASHALHTEPLDLAILARHCVAEFEERAKAAAIDLHLETQSALVNGDERRIRELLRNLLENGLRHARTRLSVRTNQQGRTATITIADDGPGIEPSQQERIFERFFRSNEQSEGLGLGLSIGRWIALAHGGELRASNQQGGGGALFTVTFPALPSA
ncbi:MAG: HAMP domain-containing histidine kinase [Candidatus Eremiobacteraeota bacterium]|nr:HAMP domain-containing histidine kinase [Candidatus Eremiobacteraeota bacterium]